MNQRNLRLAPESAEQMEGHQVAADGDHLPALLWRDSPDRHASAKAFDGATGFGERIAQGLALNDNALLLAGALPAAAFALVVHALFEVLERAWRR